MKTILWAAPKGSNVCTVYIKMWHHMSAKRYYNKSQTKKWKKNSNNIYQNSIFFFISLSVNVNTCAVRIKHAHVSKISDIRNNVKLNYVNTHTHLHTYTTDRAHSFFHQSHSRVVYCVMKTSQSLMQIHPKRIYNTLYSIWRMYIKHNKLFAHTAHRQKLTCPPSISCAQCNGKIPFDFDAPHFPGFILHQTYTPFRGEMNKIYI